MNKRSKNGRFLRFAVVVLTMVTAVAAAQTVSIPTNSPGAFANLSKYAWGKNFLTARQTPELNAHMERTLIDAINRELAAKGYTLDEKAPDFFIHVEALAHDETAVSANTDFRLPVNTTVYTSQKPGGQGVSLIPAVIPEVRIIATDASNKPLFESVTSKKYKDPEKARNNIDKEITQFAKKGLQKFPAASKR